MRKMKVLVYVATISALTVGVFGCGNTSQRDYETAVNLMSSGEYEESIEKFTALGEYEDSADKIKECNYNLALEQMDQQNWEGAIEYLDGLEYSDSENLLNECYFIIEIEDDILNRAKMSDNGDSLTNIINAEYTFLEPFRDVEMSDDVLKSARDLYFSGLDLQRDTLDKSYFEYQYNWLDGYIQRCEALKIFHDEYGICKDDKDFVSTYLSSIDSDKHTLEAYKALDDDMTSQLEDFEFEVVDYNLTQLKYTNNTEYTVDVDFHFQFYDEDDVRVDDGEYYFENVQPGSTNKFDIYYSQDWVRCEFFWEYIDVR